jgi:hypothetical protein
MRLAGYLPTVVSPSPSLRILIIQITTEGVLDSSVKEVPVLAIRIVPALTALYNRKVSATILER